MVSRPPISFKYTVELVEFLEGVKFKKEAPTGLKSKWISTPTRCDVVWKKGYGKKKRPGFLQEIEARDLQLKNIPRKHYLLPQWATDEYIQSRKFSNSPGFLLMDKMGWVPNTPLGIRGGIIEPIMQTEKDRVQGNYAGIGYEDMRDTNPENEFIEIICVGDHYGVALWRNEKVFVPKGAIKHLINITNSQLNLVGIGVMADMVLEEGKRYKWRIKKVREVVDTVF